MQNLADKELSRARSLPAGARKERLVVLTEQYPWHGPSWLALAIEHHMGRRHEEASAAAGRAIEADPHLAYSLPHGLVPSGQRGVAMAGRAAPRPIAAAPPVAPRARGAGRLDRRGDAARAPAPQPVPARGPRSEPALADVLRGSPVERRQRLKQLTAQFPRSGAIWLALAEEDLAARRIEESLAAFDRAVACDPASEDNASHALVQARRLHREQSQAPRRAPAPRPALPPPDDDESPEADATTVFAVDEPPPPPSAAPPVPAPPPVDDALNDPSGNLIGHELVRLLERRDPELRLTGLRELASDYPDNVPVLYHLAIESAVAGEIAHARRAAARLRELSPQRYHELYRVAERHFARFDREGARSKSRDADEDSIIVDPDLLSAAVRGTPTAATVIMEAMSLGGGQLCEQCWSVFEDDVGTCPDRECRAPKPAGGWGRMPYRFGKYVFTALLGRGAMGAVFAAQTTDDPDAQLAVKVIRKHLLARQPEVLDMFRQEARGLTLLGQHPQFVRVTGCELEVVPPHLCMERIEWPSLRDVLKREGPLDVRAAVSLGISVLDGVCVMHEHNMVHCDLKPDNILVRFVHEQFETKIADLGSWVYDQRTQSGRERKRELYGTLTYLSPEQTRGDTITVASDMHAFGSMMWEALTGAVPFPIHGSTVRDQLELRYNATRALPRRPLNMPPELYDIVSHAMAPDWMARPSAADTRWALKQYAFQLSLLDGPELARAYGRRPRMSGSRHTQRLLAGKRPWYRALLSDPYALTMLGLSLLVGILLAIVLFSD